MVEAKIEKEDPKRMKDLTESADPRVKKSKRDIADPTRA